jgi:hypothetical protein
LFISGFVNIVNSTDQTRGREITPEVEVTFQSPKETLCTAPILAYRQPGEKFTVDTDASRVRIGGVLSQVQDGQEQVIAYYSKTLNKAERNYCATGWELLAIVRTLEHGNEFHLLTDHSTLIWLMNYKNLEGQISF